MASSIGGVALNPLSDLIWQDRFSANDIEQTNRRTLGGELVSYVGTLIAGRPITLLATEKFGWQHKDVVVLLMALSSVPGAIYEFVFGAETYQVMFDHSQGPAVDMQPNMARATHDDQDYFTGQIKLLTV